MILPLRPRRIKLVHRISRGSGAKAVLRTFGFQHVMPCAHNCADFHDLSMRREKPWLTPYIQDMYMNGGRFTTYLKVTNAVLVGR
jgi:hypothetical protein